MTQEDKELLVKDLCSRLPYGVKCKDININVTGTLSQIGLHYDMCTLDKDDGESESCYLLNCKPYLFPMSSMTEEQKFEFNVLQVKTLKSSYATPMECITILQWCYKNHIDVNGLIPLGLANDATGLNIY